MTLAQTIAAWFAAGFAFAAPFTYRAVRKQARERGDAGAAGARGAAQSHTAGDNL